MKVHRLVSLGVALVAVCGASFAQVTSADFREELGFPEYGGGDTRILERINVALPFVIPSGPQLTEADEIANPENYRQALNVTFDPTTNVLSLTGTGVDVYQEIVVTLTNVTFGTAGQQVIGLSAISTGNAATAGEDSPDLFPTISSSFTSNSLTITYAVPFVNDQVFSIATGTDTFQVVLGQANVAAPEPVSLAFFALPLVGMVVRRARRN